MKGIDNVGKKRLDYSDTDRLVKVEKVYPTSTTFVANQHLTLSDDDIVLRPPRGHQEGRVTEISVERAAGVDKTRHVLPKTGASALEKARSLKHTFYPIDRETDRS